MLALAPHGCLPTVWGLTCGLTRADIGFFQRGPLFLAKLARRGIDRLFIGAAVRVGTGNNLVLRYQQGQHGRLQPTTQNGGSLDGQPVIERPVPLFGVLG
jgi:hypothetical protein